LRTRNTQPQIADMIVATWHRLQAAGAPEDLGDLALHLRACLPDDPAVRQANLDFAEICAAYIVLRTRAPA